MPLTLLDRLERRFGRFAIPNLTTFLVVGQAVLYVASRLPQGVALDRVEFDPVRITQGEVWRLLTFLFYPPARDPLLVIFYFMMFLFIGTMLERLWGDFRFNLYIFIGWFANVAAAFIVSAVLGRMLPEMAEGPGKLVSVRAFNWFLYGSMFFAFARLYPDFVIRIMLVLPIRAKWLALIEWLTFGYFFLVGNWMIKALILATVLNYLLFFGREHIRDFRQQRRKRTFQKHATKSLAAPTHQCRVCGANSGDSPRMAFRYCSKCAGQACYCPEHIGSHEHVTAEEPSAS